MPAKKRTTSAVDIRSNEWSKEWVILIEAYGGPQTLAETIGVHYQSLWRYGVKGDPPPKVFVNFVRVLAATKGLKSPV